MNNIKVKDLQIGDMVRAVEYPKLNSDRTWPLQFDGRVDGICIPEETDENGKPWEPSITLVVETRYVVHESYLVKKLQSKE